MEPAWADVVSGYEGACRSLPTGEEGEVSSGEEDNGLDSDEDDEVTRHGHVSTTMTGHQGRKYVCVCLIKGNLSS